MQTPAQQLISETHETLRRNVVEFKKGYEVAVQALTAFETAYGITVTTEAPVTTPVETRPAPTAPAPVVTQTYHADDGRDRGTNKDGTPRKKPGPPKGTNVHAPKTHRAKASAKAAQPAKTKKPAKTTALAKAKTNGVKAKANGKSAQKQPSRPGPKPGAKREGVPSLINATQIVLGNKTMNAEQVFEALKAKGWLPNSSDPLGYVRYTLSKNKDIFLRVEGKRGYYHLDKDVAKPEKKNGAAKTAPKNLPAPSAVETKASVAPDQTDTDAVVDDVDDLLAKSGIDISGPNPFAGSNAS